MIRPPLRFRGEKLQRKRRGISLENVLNMHALNADHYAIDHMITHGEAKTTLESGTRELLLFGVQDFAKGGDEIGHSERLFDEA